jgi:hypothetical protein
MVKFSHNGPAETLSLLGILLLALASLQPQVCILVAATGNNSDDDNNKCRPPQSDGDGGGVGSDEGGLCSFFTIFLILIFRIKLIILF